MHYTHNHILLGDNINHHLSLVPTRDNSRDAWLQLFFVDDYVSVNRFQSDENAHSCNCE